MLLRIFFVHNLVIFILYSYFLLNLEEQETSTMQISSTLSSASVSGAASQTSTSSSQLEKQISKLQAEIEKINQSDKDGETKQKEVEQLQVQIQQITMKMQQLENQQKNDQKQTNTANQTDTIEISSKAAALFGRQSFSSDDLSGVGKANLK